MLCPRHRQTLALLLLVGGPSSLALLDLACSNPGTSPADGGARDARPADAGTDRAAPDAAVDAADTAAPTDATRIDVEALPFLAELRVAFVDAGAEAGGDAGAGITLVPPFSPAVHDYYVRCSEGPNPIVVSMTASLGATSLLARPTLTSSLPKQTVSLSVLEDEAIVAIATNSAATTEYWVRCLPHDFPALSWSEHPEAGAPTPGYYVLGTYQTAPSKRAYAFVLDAHGVPVWYSAQRPAWRGVCNVDSLSKGTISFISGFVSQAAPYQIRGLSPLATTDVSTAALDFHELRLLPNGDHLVFAAPFVNDVDLTGLALPLPDGGSEPLGKNSIIADCNIVELSPTGDVVWQWVGTEHLDPVLDCTYPRPGSPTGLGEKTVDPFHCNSIDVDPGSGNLLVSARHMDSIFYVERSSGKILWKLGGTPHTEDGATYVPVADPFHRQHDARLAGAWSSTCSGASGRVSMFDDETALPGPARAVLYDVRVQSPGDGGGAADCGAAADGGSTGATVAWQYAEKGSSEGLGSFRTLADGSRVIGWGYGNAAHLTFTELDVAGNDVLDMAMDPTQGDVSFRAIKVPLTELDLPSLRSTAGLP